MEKYIVSKAIGIDLGTTNSVVALMNTTDTEIDIYRQMTTKGELVKRETTPSCVWKDARTGQIVVGQKAFAQIGHFPRPIRSIKRLMGSQETVILTDELATPEEISAHILREMKLQAELGLAKQATAMMTPLVDRAIVTIPAYFDQPQIEATRRAAEMAGLTVLELLHEPVAAACYHCWETNTHNGIFLVYDLGGGTFDVSIVRCTEGEFEVLGISGDKRLGGDDIDTLLAEELRIYLQKEDYDLELDLEQEDDQLRFDALKMLAEGVKKALSDREEYTLRDTATLQDRQGERVTIDRTFERAELEAIMRPVIERTLPHCFLALDQAERKAGITLADVDAVILAGGSTHIPLVREMVTQALCTDANVHRLHAKCAGPVYKKVDTIVALGAAIRAAATGGVVVYNPEKTVRVFFRGVSTTDAQQMFLSGEIAALTSSINLTDGQVRLFIPEQGYEDVQDLKANGSFSFTHIPLQSSTDNMLLIEVYDSSGTQVLNTCRTIRQSKETVRPTGGSTGTAKLPKALILDVVDKDNQLYKEVLIEELATLPVHKDFTFYYRGDNPVRFPLYQKAKKIYEAQITLENPPKVGTSIPVSVDIDALANISMSARIGGVSSAWTIDAPSVPDLPATKVVQDAEQTFRKAVVALPAKKRSVVESRYRYAKQSYEAAISRRDYSTAMHDYEEMEEVIGDLRFSTVSLQPPKHDFDDLVRRCHKLNEEISYHQLHLKSPYNYREMFNSIDEQRIEGEEAFENDDQTGYDNAIQMLKSLFSYLQGLADQILQAIDTRTDMEKLHDSIESLLQDVDRLDHDARKQGKHNEQRQLESIRQKLYDVRYMNTSIAQKTLYQCRTEFDHIKNMLQNSTRQADTRGLVEKKFQF